MSTFDDIVAGRESNPQQGVAVASRSKSVFDEILTPPTIPQPEPEPGVRERAVDFMKKASAFYQKKVSEPKKPKKPEKSPFDMPKDIVKGFGKKIAEDIKGIPQLPGKIVAGAKGLPGAIRAGEEQREQFVRELGRGTPEQKVSALSRETEKTAKQVADVTSLGLGPGGYALTRGAKAVGLAREGVAPEDIGRELAGDVEAFATILGTRTFIRKLTGKSVAEISKTKTVEVDPKKAFDLYRRVAVLGKGSPQEQAIFNELTKMAEQKGVSMTEFMRQPKPFTVEIPKGVAGPRFKPQPKPSGTQVSGPLAKPTTKPQLPVKAPGFPKGASGTLPVKPFKEEIPIAQPPAKGETFNDYAKNIGVLRQGIERAKAVTLQLGHGFDVEKPFRDAKAPETGLAVKTMMSKMSVGEEKALEFVKKINKLGLNKAELDNLSFVVENSAPAKGKDLQAATEIRKELDADLELLKKRGALKTGFPESMIERLELEKTTATKAEVRNIDSKLERLRNIKYMPIQLKILMEDVINDRIAEGKSLKDLPMGEGGFASLKKIKGRKSVSLRELVERGIVPKEKADARKLVATYKRFIYNKLAEKDVIDSAIKEKLAVPDSVAPDNFVEIPTRYAPDLKGYKVDPVFADYLTDTLGALHGKPNPIAKAASIVKMLQFYNPLFLPLNDITQAAMLGSLQTPGLPKYTKNAIEMMVKRTPEYYEALENGLASTPHKNPFRVFRAELEKVTRETDSVPARVIENLKRYGKTVGKDLIGDLYSTSWNIAWKLDRTVRFVSYNYLRDRGYSSKDAAQIAAAFHGDYAGVPAKTRRMLNNVFFTPTFKIAMTKLYGSMIKGIVKTAGGKGTPKDKAFGKGLLWTAAFIMGRRMFMNKLGFKEEEFNRKYSIEVDTSAGKKKLIKNFADPTNIPMRYYYRFLKTRPEDLNVASRIWQGVTYELNPLWKMAINFKENRKFGGGQIYKPFDDTSDQLKDISQWAISETVGILKPFLKKKTKQERLMAEGIKNSSYPLLLNAMKIYSFQYGADLDFQRNAKALSRLQREFQYNEKKYFMEGDAKGHENRLRNFLKRIKQIAGRKK